jgi:chromosome segregation ATPase
MSELITPIAQILLAIALFLVAIMCMRLDAKLNALRKGKDGVAASAAQLSQAVTRADAAIKALRTHTEEATTALQARIDEAQGVADGLKFLTTTARALEPKANQVREARSAREASREDRWEDDDFRPARSSSRSSETWGGLR